MSIEELS